MRFRLSLLAGVALMGAANMAHAQEAATVDEVVVTGLYTVDKKLDTATGLGLSVRETPQSVTVITQQRIKDQNLSTISDVVRNTAGVSMIEVDDVRNVFNARGFEIKNYQIDGVPTSWSLAGDSGETVADVSIYERIEIVRGATGLLTGAGDPSGSINLVRKHADSREFKGSITGTLASWDKRRVETDISGALNDGQIRGRFVAKYEAGDTYFDRQSTEKHVLYGVVEADLTDSTLLRAGASSQVTAPNAAFWGALPTFYTDGGLTKLPVSTNTAANWAYWDTENTNVFANLQHTFGNGWRLSANYNRLLNEQNSQLFYLYGNMDRATGVGLATFPYKANGQTTQDSLDIQLRGDYSLFGREHELTVGALASKQVSDVSYFQAGGPNAFAPMTSLYGFNGDFPKPDFASAPTQYTDNETKQSGLFVATRLNISDQLKVIGGARLSQWERNGINGGTAESYKSDDVVIPYVGALYDLTENHRLYGSYTEIFQPQNLRDVNAKVLDPIKGKAYEIGLKSAFLNENLQSDRAGLGPAGTRLSRVGRRREQRLRVRAARPRHRRLGRQRQLRPVRGRRRQGRQGQHRPTAQELRGVHHLSLPRAAGRPQRRRRRQLAQHHLLPGRQPGQRRSDPYRAEVIRPGEPHGALQGRRGPVGAGQRRQPVRRDLSQPDQLLQSVSVWRAAELHRLADQELLERTPRAMLLQALGILVQAAGLAVLFLHWRAKGGLGGPALAGAWALIVLGAAPWLLTVSPEKAVALGSLAPMLFGLALLAPDALPRVVNGKVRRQRPVREAADDSGIAAPGRASRNVARWFGALVAAPAVAAAATAAWLAYAPWNAVDSMVLAAFLLMAVVTAAWLWLLASLRPWRVTLICCGAALLLAALAVAGAH